MKEWRPVGLCAITWVPAGVYCCHTKKKVSEGGSVSCSYVSFYVIIQKFFFHETMTLFCESLPFLHKSFTFLRDNSHICAWNYHVTLGKFHIFESFSSFSRNYHVTLRKFTFLSDNFHIFTWNYHITLWMFHILCDDCHVFLHDNFPRYHMKAVGANSWCQAWFQFVLTSFVFCSDEHSSWTGGSLWSTVPLTLNRKPVGW